MRRDAGRGADHDLRARPRRPITICARPRVNAVAPGVIATDMTAELRALAPDELHRRILMGRVGTADDVARVVAFLAAPDACYVTGQVWNVDGGGVMSDSIITDDPIRCA